MVLLRRGVLTRFLLLGCEDFAYIAVKAFSENEWLVQEIDFLIALLILMRMVEVPFVKQDIRKIREWKTTVGRIVSVQNFYFERNYHSWICELPWGRKQEDIVTWESLPAPWYVQF